MFLTVSKNYDVVSSKLKVEHLYGYFIICCNTPSLVEYSTIAMSFVFHAMLQFLHREWNSDVKESLFFGFFLNQNLPIFSSSISCWKYASFFYWYLIGPLGPICIIIVLYWNFTPRLQGVPERSIRYTAARMLCTANTRGIIPKEFVINVHW